MEPHRKFKNAGENDIISEVSSFMKKFSKNSLKFNYSIESSSKIFNVFLEISQQFGFFVKTREKLTQGFLKYCGVREPPDALRDQAR